jgi:DNA-binding SARP family transcriptional activator
MADWAAVERLIVRDAENMIAQGRWKSVVEWIEQLPPESVTASPWLLHWCGAAYVAVEPARARQLLEQSHSLAQLRSDRLCELQSAAGIVQTYMMQYRTFRPFDRWIPVLELALDREFTFPSLETELRILSALFVALSYRNPVHPRLPACRERMFELVQTGADFPLRLNAAFYLLFHGATTGLLRIADRAEPILRELLKHPEVTALNAAVCWFSLSWYYCRAGRYEQCDGALTCVEQIAQANGLVGVRSFAAVIGFWLEVQRGNLEAAEVWSTRLEERMLPGHLYTEASNHGIKGWLAMLQGQPDRANERVTRACAIFDELGSHMHQIVYRAEVVWANIAKGDFEAAKKWIAEARAIAGEDTYYWSKPIFFAAEACMALINGDRALALERMEHALSTMREQGHDFTLLQHRVSWVTDLLAVALTSKAEGAYAKSLIGLYRLKAPSNAPENWPWPVRVCALGRFELIVDGKPVVFTSKVPKKPLKMLKALICHGPRMMNDWQIIDALWPDEEGDASRDAFRVTLHRLRKILGRTDSVESQDGKLRLNPDVCWVDAWELERITEGNEPVTNWADHLFKLYVGPLLPTDMMEPWTSSARERLRTKLAQLLHGKSILLQRSEALNEVMAICQRATEIDPEAVQLQQAMVACLKHAGQQKETLPEAPPSVDMGWEQEAPK